MSHDFVTPGIERLPLSDGKYIDVKHELTAGERRHVYGRMYKTARVGEGTELDHDKVGLTKIVAYLIGWSLTDKDGKPVTYSPDLPESVRDDLINNLTTRRYVEISEAIDAYEKRLEDSHNRPGWREAVLTDIALAKATGMSYGDIAALPESVHRVLLEEFIKQQEPQEALAG
jgi:hypothetical protein